MHPLLAILLAALFAAPALGDAAAPSPSATPPPGLPIPVPVVERLVPPALVAAKDFAIEGRHFAPVPDSTFEVHLGAHVVEATRESDSRIVVASSAVAPLLRELGLKRERSYPVWVVVGGERSNRVSLATVNTTHGAIHGKVEVAKHRMAPGGAKVRIPERNLEAEVAADGSYAFRDLPPVPTRLVLEWPGVTAPIEATVTVKPGETVSAAPFKVEPPAPSISSVAPDTIKEPEPLLVKGEHFLSDAKAPYEVLIDGKPVRSIRAREDAIQVPSAGLRPFLDAVSRKTGRKTSKLIVKVAGVATKPVVLTFVRLKVAPERKVAREDDAE